MGEGDALEVVRVRSPVKTGLTMLAVVGLCAYVCAQEPSPRDVLWQTSTIGALLQGVYDGPVSLGELRAHGDLGLGTVNALDGELIVLDGRCLTVDGTGAVHEQDSAVLTPFAAITWFDADRVQALRNVDGLAALQQAIDAMLPSRNLAYALRITGDFEYVRTRSVPRQTRPYPPLVEVTRDQPTFEFERVQGTLVGFRLPSFVAGINVPGYHLHFLTAALDGGGHLLDCRICSAVVAIDDTPELLLSLPTTDEFFQCVMPDDQGSAVQAVEQEPESEQ